MLNLTTHPDSPNADLIYDDAHLREEMQRLAADQAELLEARPETGLGNDVTLAIWQAENAELRAKLEELDKAWGERQREYENLLEEKSEVIRGLHLKIQQMQEAGGQLPEPAVKEDFDQIRRELEEDRRRIQEDEEALMVQMRQMEMAMSKERVELARQRSELQRLQADLNREIEMAARDGSLRDRLQSLRKSIDQSPADGAAAVAKPTPSPKKQSSGILRRIFG